MVNKLSEDAAKDGAESYVYTSATHDTTRNPLSVERKIQFMEQIFPNVSVRQETSPYSALRSLSEQGYKNVKLYVGSDRVKQFEDIHRYINHKDPAKSYNFEHFEIVNAGERLEEGNLVSRASGTLLRNLTLENNFESFRKFIPTDNIDLSEEIFYALREGLGLLSEAEKIQNISRKINEIIRTNR